MAIKFLDAIDLTGLEIQNVAAQSLGANPAQADSYAGQFIFNTATKSFNYNTGAAWIALDGSGNIDSIVGATGLKAVTSSGVATISPIVDGDTNLVLAQVDGKDDVLVGADSLIINIAETGLVKKVLISQISAAAGGGTVTGVTGTLPIVSSGGNAPAISINTFTGADGTDAGLKGAVPAPVAADNVKYLKGDGTWASVPAGYAGWDLKVETGDAVTIATGAIVDFKGAGGITFSRAGSVVTATSTNGAGTMSSWKLGADSGTEESVLNGQSIDIAGGEGIVTSVAADRKVNVVLKLDELATETTVLKTDLLAGVYGADGEKAGAQKLAAISSIGLSMLAVPTTDLDMNGKQVSNVPSTPAAATDAASKAYVDLVATGSGALIFQGGYNAETNEPVLDDRGTPIAVNKGWTYAVTTKGTFYGEVVEDGDLLIAEVDNAAALANWTVVQNNVGVASATVLGIANFPTAGGLSVTAGAVSLADSGVTAATYGTAAKVAQVTVDAKGIVTGASDVDISIAASAVKDFCAEVEACVGKATREKTGTFGEEAATIVEHNFGTTNVMVQCFGTESGDTVNVKVTRKDANTVILTTAKPFGAAGLSYLMQKIGA